MVNVYQFCKSFGGKSFFLKKVERLKKKLFVLILILIVGLFFFKSRQFNCQIFWRNNLAIIIDEFWVVAKSWPTGPNLDVTAFSRRWYRSCHDHEDNPRILTLSRRSKGKGVEQVLLINSYIAYYVNITLRFCGDYSKGIIIGKLKWKLPNKSLDILPHNGDWDPVSLTLFLLVSLRAVPVLLMTSRDFIRCCSTSTGWRQKTDHPHTCGGRRSYLSLIFLLS